MKRVDSMLCIFITHTQSHTHTVRGASNVNIDQISSLPSKCSPSSVGDSKAEQKLLRDKCYDREAQGIGKPYKEHQERGFQEEIKWKLSLKGGVRITPVTW